ncbi:MAG: potassium-transporting ATPase subunit KdpC [Actinobacteria bacterium]|nr:potassium-transporting ATPase subunit KdpC [Actinomycetota bacterium]
MVKRIVTASVILITMTVLVGILYPLVVTGLAQVIFPKQAGGSLIYQQGMLVGSEIIGQQFTSPGYFHGRPSATGEGGYDAGASSGSNLGPTNKTLLDEIARRATELRSDNGLPSNAKLPPDLVTASASGLDPHISPAAAELQVTRVANARNLTESRVREIIDANIEGRQFGFLGEPRVNVLRLNRDLDEISR